jgi:hypothetical protein
MEQRWSETERATAVMRPRRLEHKTDADEDPGSFPAFCSQPVRCGMSNAHSHHRVESRRGSPLVPPMTTPAFFGAPYSEENDLAGLIYI